VLFLGAFVFVSQKYFDYRVTNDGKSSQIAQVQLDAQKAANTQSLAQAQQTLADYRTALDVYSKQNSTLAAAIAARDKGVQTQQATDAKLPPTGLAARWAALAQVDTSEIVPTSSGLNVTEDAALTTVNQLEMVPVLTQDLSDKQKQIDNLNVEAGKSQAVISQGTTLVDGLQLQLKDQTASCKIQVQTVTDKANKSKLKWFGAGFVTGFLGGGWLGLHL